MKEKCIPVPNELDWNNTAEGFKNLANFPNCIGAVDGKHIRIMKPMASGSITSKNYTRINYLRVSTGSVNYCAMTFRNYLFPVQTYFQYLVGFILNFRKHSVYVADTASRYAN